MTFIIKILINALQDISKGHKLFFVVSPRIELGYQVPETCVLSIVLRDQFQFYYTKKQISKSVLTLRTIPARTYLSVRAGIVLRGLKFPVIYDELFYQSMRIGGKDLYGNSQQYYAKKFSYGN